MPSPFFRIAALALASVCLTSPFAPVRAESSAVAPYLPYVVVEPARTAVWGYDCTAIMRRLYTFNSDVVSMLKANQVAAPVVGQIRPTTSFAEVLAILTNAEADTPEVLGGFSGLDYISDDELAACSA